MNSRERFLKAFEFKRADRLPFTEFLGYWQETIWRLSREGLPVEAIRIGINDYFGFDKRESIPLDLGPIPRFVPKVLSEDERTKVIRQENGIIVRVFKKGCSMPQFIEHPVKNEEDFENIKSRYDPTDLRRLPKTWGEELFEYYEQRDFLLVMSVTGFFGQVRNWLGLKKTLVWFITKPELIKSMIDFWCDFLIRVTDLVLKDVTPDLVTIWEDMCYKGGPLISPRHFKRLMLPAYRRLTEHLKAHGIRYIFVDSDGDIRPLMPLWRDGGVNGLYPLEVAAGVRAEEIVEKYGKGYVLIGNFDKRALIRGKKEIDKEIERLKPLIENCTLIPSVDHAVPADVPLENYLYYLSKIKKLL